MTDTFSYSADHVHDVATEQIGYFRDSPLIRQLPSSELLLGTLAVKCVESTMLYRNPSAKFVDEPKTDTLMAIIDMPTVIDLQAEFGESNKLSKDDIFKLYIGLGIANLLIASSFAGSRRMSRMEKFIDALSDPQGLYASTVESKIFDNPQADETALALVTDGYRQTSNVNAVRLTSGMFIETQPDANAMRKKVEHSFQDELSQLFKGKEQFLHTIEKFNVNIDEAKAMFANNVETIMGMAFPMEKRQIIKILKLLK